MSGGGERRGERRLPATSLDFVINLSNSERQSN